MRECGAWLGLLLVVLALLYGGLNLAEGAIAGMTASANRHQAFLLRGGSPGEGGISVAFAGRGVHLSVDSLGGLIGQWWSRWGPPGQFPGQNP